MSTTTGHETPNTEPKNEQREFKFRAWFNGQMYDDAYINKYTLAHWLYSIKCPVMQYIGLHDNNSNEVFEGDIIRLNNAELVDTVADGDNGYREVYEDIIGTVVYEDAAFHYTGHSAGTIPMFGADDFEVIGNIYENPELL